MATILINITHGSEAPTRAALGFLVGRAAVEEGHKARGYEPDGVAEAAMPKKLVELTLQSDKVLTY